MQMNNDYIYIHSLNFLDDMIDDDHVLILMLIYMDNRYNKKLELFGIYAYLIDIQ
jgi:hypothetical protein